MATKDDYGDYLLEYVYGNVTVSVLVTGVLEDEIRIWGLGEIAYEKVIMGREPDNIRITQIIKEAGA